MTGVLLKVVSGFYYVDAGGAVYECKPRGNVKREIKRLLAGDRVEISEINGDKAVLQNVLPRDNSLVRPPIANLKTLVIVSSQNTPAPNALLIDRLCAIANKCKAEPVVVFNKSDCGDLSVWEGIYKKAGIKCFVVSALQPESLSELKNLLIRSGGISVFTGNSGVGKSSILNAMFGELSLETGEVSEKLGRGRHTTRVSQLFKLKGGGYVADTPGFSSLDIQRYEPVFKDELPFCFVDFKPYLGKCRFNSCSHICEKDCAVIEAVKRGEIDKSRYESYKQIFAEVKDLKEWQLKNKA